jgi:non-heme chloroperoxidase
MATIKTALTGTEIYYTRPGVPDLHGGVQHGWPLSAGRLGGPEFFLPSAAYRCIAHDRRGHGRLDAALGATTSTTTPTTSRRLVQGARSCATRSYIIRHYTGGGEVSPLYYAGRDRGA